MTNIVLQVGVKAFLTKGDGRYLLVHRSAEKYKGTSGSWDIVGGRIDPGTRLMENLRREIQEETQMSIVGEPGLIHAQDIIPNAERHIVRLTYLAQTEGEPVLDTTENVEYKWLTSAEMLAHDDLDIYVKEILTLGLLEK
jgi:ADP-ribose pyrophosphatase YjhB (NUDIX family)